MFKRTSAALSSLSLIVVACSSSSNNGVEGSGNSSQGGTYGNIGGTGNNAGNGNTAANGNNAGSGNTAADGNNAGSGNIGNGGDGGSGAGANSDTGGIWGGTAGGSSVCQPLTSTGQQEPPVIMFQIDITNSMTNVTPTTGNQSKWQATQAALEAVLPELPQDWVVGMTFFNKPAPQNGGCYDGTQFPLVVPAALSQNLTAINAAINGITLQASVATWTPTLNAWQYAFNYITGTWPNSDQYATSHKYIVFMTDGVPTVNRDGCTSGNSCPDACVSQSEYDYFVQTITDTTAASNGAETFFIGVPGSDEAQGAPYDPRDMLSELAFAGGTAPAGSTAASCAAATPGNYCHIDLTTTADFSSALESAIKYTVGNSVTKSCVFNVPTPPADKYFVDLAHTEVDYISSAGTQKLQAASSSDCTDGDFYTDSPTNATTLTLCPTMCTQLNADASAQVTVTFACSIIG